MNVLIVSKTRMSSYACVGGLVLSDNRYVRLLNPGNHNQPEDTDFEIGGVWDIKFIDRSPLHRPHIEDVIIISKTFRHQVNDISDFIENRNIIDWQGHVDNLYDGLLKWTDNGSAYISIDGEMAKKSVGFWVSDKNLIKSTAYDKIKFSYPNGRNYRNISYVGYQDSVAVIPAGTIIRVSLSRAFPPDNSGISVPKGYYLQLSGWY